jgi:processive 1,2-diacylglycerol beta-glucosyltransferase
MRVLILSANTGGGHNSTARSLSQRFEELGIECDIADTLAFISITVSDIISRGHTYIYRKFPKLFGAGYHFEETHPPRFLYELCAKGADALQKKLEEGNYDAVLCVHTFSAMMMTEVRRRYGAGTSCFFVATDYTASPGVSEADLDGYFVPHRMLFGEFVRAGVPADRMYPSGIPVREEFYEVKDKRLARRELELPETGRMVLLSCGSMGCGHLEKSALLLLERLPEDCYLVVLCGSNQKTYEALLSCASKRLYPLSFTNRVPDYMSAADLYITKPGGLTTSEAIVKQTPMVFYNAVSGCETRNFNFLERMGVAEGAKSWRRVASIACRNLNSPEHLQKQVDAMKSFLPHNTVEYICRTVKEKIS